MNYPAMTTMLTDNASLPCPACGRLHSPTDTFCPHCGKAVGGLRYIREEFEASRRQYEKVADSVTRFVSAPSYFGVHVLWVAAWIVLNSGVVMVIHRFDDPPTYNLLALLLSIEAIFLNGFLLVSQSREAEYERKRAELDYETNVQTHRILTQMSGQIDGIAIRMEQIESGLRTERVNP